MVLGPKGFGKRYKLGRPKFIIKKKSINPEKMGLPTLFYLGVGQLKARPGPAEGFGRPLLTADRCTPSGSS